MRKFNKSIFVSLIALLVCMSFAAAVITVLEPASKTVKYGDTATFQCAISTIGTSSYTIKMGSTVLKSGTIGALTTSVVSVTIGPGDYGSVAIGSSKDLTVTCSAQEQSCGLCCCDGTDSSTLKIYKCPPDDWMCSVDEVRQFWDYTWNGQTCVMSITQEVEHCNDYDDCYAYGNGCEDRDYYCNEGSTISPCGHDFTNRHVDSYEAYVNYCEGSFLKKHRKLNDYYCGSTCTNHVSWTDETVVENCDLKDGWYDTGVTRWISTGFCTDKEQKEQEQRDYTCSVSTLSCSYTVIGSTRWVDTGNNQIKPDGTICAYELGICEANDICIVGVCTEKYKPYGTSCTDGQFCNGNEICNDVGQCIGGDAVSCTGFNIFMIGTCDYSPDSIHFTWDHRNAFTSTCNEVQDQCTTGISTIYHECSVLKCQAECDDTNLCAPNTCSETYNDYCVALKLADYNNNNVMDSKTVSDSCARSCLFASCECTDCSVNCGATPTQKCVPGVCGAICDSNDDCDDQNIHTIDTCLGDCSCKHDSLPYCGDSVVQAGETCELPSTSNNNYCGQANSTCNATKLGVRDLFGNCDASCGCTPDNFIYSCVKNQCGATCSADADCNDGNIHTTDTCLNNCTCKHDTNDYCGDGIVQTGETCELPSTGNNAYCSQTLNECLGNKLGTRDGFGNCDAQCGCDYDDFNYLCVKDSCGATCDDNADCADYCDGSIKHFGSTCDLSTSCSCSGGSNFDCNSLDDWYDTGNTEWVDDVHLQGEREKRAGEQGL